MLYQVTLILNPGLGVNDVQRSFELLHGYRSYYRITNNTWVLSAGVPCTPAAIEQATRHLVRPSGRIFICRLAAPDHQGWMDPEFWQWISTQGALPY